MKKSFKRMGASAMAAVMVIGSVSTAFAATPNPEVSEREKRNAKVSQYAATQGMVLLDNKENVLPIADSGKIALYGVGAYGTVKGGTGSGDVNQRDITTVWDGFKNAGYDVTTKDYLTDMKATYDEAKDNFHGGIMGTFKFDEVLLEDEQVEQGKDADTAVYVLARNSGEGADRKVTGGDYLLSDAEKANLEKLGKAYENVVVVLNVGGIIDTKFYEEIEGLDAMLLMSQAGMRGGDAVVQVLNGEVTPSGKLTDTWAVNYEDYPSSAGFSSNDENVNEEYYEDGIYVGYRYFDTWGKDVAYEFGYGLSYTDFDIRVLGVTADEENVTVAVNVTNTGDTYSGKEVVQVYFSAPDGELEKPYQELAGFAKTGELAPGESEIMKITYNTTEMSSYNEDKAAYVMEEGDYVIRVGNSSRNTEAAAVITLDETKITEQLSNQLPVQEDKELEEISKKDAKPITYEGEEDEIKAAKKIKLTADDIETVNHVAKNEEETVTTYVTDDDYKAAENLGYKEEVKKVEKIEKDKLSLVDVFEGKVDLETFVANMDLEELAALNEGIGMGGFFGSSEPIVGAQSDTVDGAAGQTTHNFEESYKIPSIVLSDGPAGLRINQSYESYPTEEDKENGTNAVTMYQYCTAFPIGTLLAQTWDEDVIREVGKAFGEEMVEMGVTILLAPGMNIHRNPLCGRNFEYYSEDPLITGMTSAAETSGIQADSGVGVMVKHFAFNNQENNRNRQDSIISERAIREIYLKGFEYVIKQEQPMAVMSSYNKINGTYTMESWDLLENILREEWGFKGFVSTDWMCAGNSSLGMHAGNDMIQPGGNPQELVKGVVDVEPTFGEDGYPEVTKQEFWGNVRYNTNWGEFAISEDGAEEVTVTVEKEVYEAGTRETAKDTVETVPDLVEAIGGIVEENEDGTVTITYQGSYPENIICLGDLQKSSIRNMNIILQSYQMYASLDGYKGTDAPAYSAQFEDLNDYISVERSLFDDVRNGDWYTEYVADVYAKGIMTGMNDTHFGVMENLVRAQFATVLYRMEGEPEVKFEDKFDDVKDGNFYSDAVTWAAEAGIVKGYDDTGLFGTNDPITREQMAEMMYRYAQYKKVDTDAKGDLTKFPDADKLQDFSVEGVTWAVGEGIIKGDNNKLNPQGSTNRAEASAIISRYTELVKE